MVAKHLWAWKTDLTTTRDQRTDLMKGKRVNQEGKDQVHLKPSELMMSQLGAFGIYSS